MAFSVGNKVVYPSQGPCLIGPVVKKTVAGRSAAFYQLASLADSGEALFVPVDKIAALGIRQLLPPSEVPKLLGHLERSIAAVPNWKQRDLHNQRLLSSGSAYDLAEVIESLTELNAIKALSPRDRQVLDKARRFLICEIAEVMGKTRNAVEAQVDSALKLRSQVKPAASVATV